MKLLKAVLPSLLACALLFLACGTDKPQQTSGSEAQTENRESLRQALDNQEIQVAICGLGLSSGTALLMAIKSMVSRPLRIDIQSGTVLKSNDSESQDMAIDEVEREYEGPSTEEFLHACHDAAEQNEKFEQMLESATAQPSLWHDANAVVLGPYSTHVYSVSGYCLDFEKENPSTSTTFQVAQSPPRLTSRLFSYVAQHRVEYSVRSVQLATWAVSGNQSAEHIEEKFPYSSDDLKNACRLLDNAGIHSSSLNLCSN